MKNCRRVISLDDSQVFVELKVSVCWKTTVRSSSAFWKSRSPRPAFNQVQLCLINWRSGTFSLTVLPYDGLDEGGRKRMRKACWTVSTLRIVLWYPDTPLWSGFSWQPVVWTQKQCRQGLGQWLLASKDAVLCVFLGVSLRLSGSPLFWAATEVQPAESALWAFAKSWKYEG